MPKRNIKVVLNEAYMRGFLTRNIKTFFPGAKKITFFYSKYLRYLSEESFLVRYEIDLLMKNGTIKKKILRGNRVKPETYPIMQFFFLLFQKRERSVVARPLAYFADLGFLLYEEYSGWVLREFDHQLDIINKTVPIIARQLAEIHNTRTTLGTTRTLLDEQNYFSLLNKKVKRYFPSISKRFAEYQQKYINRLTKNYSPDNFVLNHGDFQASNIIYDLRTKNVGFIDFASAIRTSPANDVATFLTHTRAMLCYLFPSNRIDKLENLFLKNYFRKADKKIARQVRPDLPIFQTRICLDIITTTAVFTEYNKSPYYMKIINEMFQRAHHNLTLPRKPYA
jgi:thiamine kinase-like enzyme